MATQFLLRMSPAQVLVLAPTRELALQVSREFDTYSQNLTSFCIYGGASYLPQGMYVRSPHIQSVVDASTALNCTEYGVGWGGVSRVGGVG